MPCGGDAGSAVDVVADVALVADERRSCMDADPHADRTIGCKALRELGGGTQGAGAVGKAKKNASPCVSTSTPPCPAHASRIDRPMFGERRCIGLRAELVQQRRRAFDVGEEEGDGAGRKLEPHAGIIRRFQRTDNTRCSSDIPARWGRQQFSTPAR